MNYHIKKPEWNAGSGVQQIASLRSQIRTSNLQSETIDTTRIEIRRHDSAREVYPVKCLVYLTGNDRGRLINRETGYWMERFVWNTRLKRRLWRSTDCFATLANPYFQFAIGDNRYNTNWNKEARFCEGGLPSEMLSIFNRERPRQTWTSWNKILTEYFITFTNVTQTNHIK